MMSSDDRERPLESSQPDAARAERRRPAPAGGPAAAGAARFTRDPDCIGYG
jgi:hypothetical protein